MTTVSNSLILGGWVTKGLKMATKIGGGGGVDNDILTFFMPLTRQKMSL